MYKAALVFLLLFFSFTYVVAQEQMMPLPEFSLQNLGKGKVRIGWVNPYGTDLIQINVQRSYDSLHGYRTMFSTPSPELPANGFIDNYIEGTKVYYRIFYMLSNNAYFFSKVKKIAPGYIDPTINAINSADSVSIALQGDSSIITKLPYNLFLKFRDSVYANTKDSLLAVGQNLVVIHPYIPTGNEWRASQYMYTDRAGALNLRLPDAGERKYALHVYEADGRTQLFFIKHITDSDLIINKANFMHAGWFVFELYEGDKLKERNRFYIQKEF